MKTLPKYWHIEVTPKNIDILNEWKQKVNPNSCHANECRVIAENGAGGGWRDVGGGRREITFQQFKKHVLMEKEKIIGYKLKTKYESQYFSAAQRICGRLDGQIKSERFSICTKEAINNARHTEILDLWFEPVYKLKYSLPKINGHDGELIENKTYIKYGCAYLSIARLKTVVTIAEVWESSYNDIKSISHNRMIQSIKLDSGVEMTIEQIKQILDYVDDN